jgi:hypothetical protein
MWLAFEIRNAPHWEDVDLDTPMSANGGVASDERIPQALDLEMELLFTYPLDPFAPAMLWRPLPQGEWIEAQEAEECLVIGEQPPSMFAT